MSRYLCAPLVSPWNIHNIQVIETKVCDHGCLNLRLLYVFDAILQIIFSQCLLRQTVFLYITFFKHIPIHFY